MEKKELVEKGVKVFQALAAECSPVELEEAAEKRYGEAEKMMKSVSIPVLTNDAEVRKYIKEFDLQRPENMCRFFVESYYAGFETIASAVNGLQQENLIRVLGKIRGAKNSITIGIDNPEDGREYLRQAHEAVLEACGTLELLLQGYISQINEIDQKGKMKFFVGAKFSLSKIDTNITCARAAVDALITAVRLQALIAMQLNQKSRVVIMEHIGNIRNILSNESCDLLYAYDKNKRDGYWMQIPQKLKELEKVGLTLDEYSGLEQQNKIAAEPAGQKGGFFSRWKKQKGR